MKFITILMLALSAHVWADIKFAPKSFQHKNKQVVFVDFQTVDTLIKYDLLKGEVNAESVIQFTMEQPGLPVFDLKAPLKSALINGKQVAVNSIDSPDNVTTYMLINKQLPAGLHQLTIENSIDTNVKFSNTSVQSAFWMSDLTDRKYIEQYLPTNLEYDHYQQNLEVKIIGSTSADSHKIYTNGLINQMSKNHFKIEFPEYFTASSFFYHLTKEDEFYEQSYIYNSINGKQVPVVVYSRTENLVQKAVVESKNVLKELEQKLGAWSHPSLTVYMAGMGGMEHAGATITSFSALGHEITHSFFARGVMPADGNSGWMDEAIASWRDDGYKAVRSPNFRSTQMSGHSQYRRTTDRKAYTQGANFMAYLNHRLDSQGGLVSFLAKMHDQFVHQSITTHMFKKELELFSGENFTADFNQYIFGNKSLEDDKSLSVDNPYHPQLSQKQLMDLL